MAVYVNRSLNLKKIKLIGFDMDHTLVRYNTRAFEKLAHSQAIRILIEQYGYPEEISTLSFDYKRAIVGLVIDSRNGNLLKLNRFGKVKTAFHGLKEIHYRQVQEFYQNIAVDLRNPDFIPLDTNFAISAGVLYSQLVDMYARGLKLPSFADIAKDANHAIDLAHIDGSIKNVLKNNFDRFIVSDPLIPRLLERYVDYGKKLMLITNSDYNYSRAILDYTITPFLGGNKKWIDLFDIVITLADKPGFFQGRHRFLKVDTENGTMTNYDGPITTGVYQGGWFKKIQTDLSLQGNEILYFGDHIYGDVVAIKKLCDWRTGLVLSDLEDEVQGVKNGASIQQEIEKLSMEKATLERKINQLDIARYEGRHPDRSGLDQLFENIEQINNRISELLGEYRKFFNPCWGEVLRAGLEESRYAEQVSNYACVYMTRISDLFDYSPKTYFRPPRRLLPHETVNEE